jgi:hypothetical protein
LSATIHRTQARGTTTREGWTCTACTEKDRG